ncbi:MAG: EamA family transporter [Candidatus Poribacteria bacterium]|nr:EamA family transporter [Candidatus Poribacteria bacterium]MDE0505217.1 EamA family transporter [Candidatus Poribacteria bacterium]
MTPSTILLILLSAFFHAFWNYYAKSSKSTQIFFFWIGVFTLCLTLPVFVVRPPSIPPKVLVYVIASGLVHFFYWYSLGRAYTLGEISFVYPIARSAPAFVPLFAFLFLNESISSQGLVGIFCVVLAVYLFQRRGDDVTFKSILRYARKPDSIWAYSTLGTVILYSLIDKQGMTELHALSNKSAIWGALTYYLAEGCIALVMYNTYIIFQFRWKKVAEIGRLEWKQAITATIMAMFSYTVILSLLMTEKVSYIVALRQCSVVFAVLFGSYKLKESGLRLRLVGAALMVFGMFLISMTG